MTMEKNKLMTLDGLIERLQELREIVGTDCPINIGHNFDKTKNDSIITMVCLDSKLSANKTDNTVSIVIQKPEFKRKFKSIYY